MAEQQIARDWFHDPHHNKPRNNRDHTSRVAEQDRDMMQQQGPGSGTGLTVETLSGARDVTKNWVGGAKHVDSDIAHSTFSSLAAALDLSQNPNQRIAAAIPSAMSAVTGRPSAGAGAAPVRAQRVAKQIASPVAPAMTSNVQTVQVPFTIARTTCLADLAANNGEGAKINLKLTHAKIGADQGVVVRNIVFNDRDAPAPLRLGLAFDGLEGRKQLNLHEGRIGASYHQVLNPVGVHTSTPEVAYTADIDDVALDRYARFGKHSDLEALKKGLIPVPTYNEWHVPIHHEVGKVMDMDSKTPGVKNWQLYGAEKRPGPPEMGGAFWAVPSKSINGLLSNIDTKVYKNDSLKEIKLSDISVSIVPLVESMTFVPSCLNVESDIVMSNEMRRGIDIFITGYLEVAVPASAPSSQ